MCQPYRALRPSFGPGPSGVYRRLNSKISQNNNNNNNDDDDDDNDNNICGVKPDFKMLIMWMYQSSVRKENSTFLLKAFLSKHFSEGLLCKVKLQKKNTKEQSHIKSHLI